MKVLLIIIYMILTTSGVLFMKAGGNPGSFSINGKDITFGMNIISGIGFICYICSFLLYTRIITMFDLSYIVPICTGIVQVATLVGAYFILKEQMSIQAIIGALLVIVGIIVMNIKR